MDRFIKEAITDFTTVYKQNTSMGWEEPLVAFAGADDPLFSDLKKIVGPTHALPRDFLAEAQSVITFFLPFNEKIVESNKNGRFSSKLWAEAYIETNKLIADLNRHLQELLIEKGYKAAYAPATHNFNQKTLLSDWSHRSAAFIAGLGTFGVNRMLITEKGCCGRIGSIVTDLKLKPDQRPENEYCLHKAGGSCGLCVEKCVNEALTPEAFDKHKCYEMLLLNAKKLADLKNTADVCGKCLVGLPCSTSAAV